MIAPRRTVRSSSAWYAARISSLAAAGNAASRVGVVNQAPRFATAPLTSTERCVGVNTAVEALYLHGGISGYLVGVAGAGAGVAACRGCRRALFFADAVRWGFFLTAADLPLAAVGAGGVAGAVVARAYSGTTSVP